MFDVAVYDGICRLTVEDGRWLTTGVPGGFVDGPTALNLTVPADFDRRDLEAYVAERCHAAGIDQKGPALLTAVDQAHARGASAEGVTVVATAGLTNPATLPLSGEAQPAKSGATTRQADADRPPEEGYRPGTVNILVATDRSLADGPLASALATATAAKTATLVELTGFTGTTSDAIAVGTTRDGDSTTFVGSGTDFGVRIRACVRDAVRAGLAAYYADSEVPDSVEAAEYGRVTAAETEVFEL